MSNGTTLYLDLSQRMCHGLFLKLGQPHEFGTERILEAFLRPGDTFVDAGANVGYYTVIGARLVGETGKVIAVEPQPSALKVLLLNAQSAGQHVSVKPVALSDHRGDATFYARSEGDTSSLAADENAHSVSVRVETLDAVCSACSQVNFIKIDVEGYEPEVLRGAYQTITRHRPWVCFELLPTMVASGRVKVQEIAAYFRNLNYVCNWVNHDLDGALVTPGPSNYVLATPREHVYRFGSDLFEPIWPSLSIG